MNTDTWWQSIPLVGELVRSKSVSPVELVKAHLERIEKFNPSTNSFITVMEEQALRSAHFAEREIMAGNYRGVLHGIPIALKDLFWTKGTRTTAGSRILADFVPTDDSTVGQRLQAAGAVCLGKTHMSEFALAGGGNNAHFGPGRNPWDLEHIAGGSSTGSASAVVAGLCMGAMGSDTGGSIRSPAAYCGVVGLKPTLGRMSRYGVVRFPARWTTSAHWREPLKMPRRLPTRRRVMTTEIQQRQPEVCRTIWRTWIPTWMESSSELRTTGSLNQPIRK